MIISVAQVLLFIGSLLIVVAPPVLYAGRTRHNHASCPPFPHIFLDHGKITNIGSQKYLFKCDPGFFLTSPSQVRCWRGKWTSTKKPTCSKAEDQCEDPDPLAGGEILGEERHEGAIIQYMCKEGFTLLGEGMRTCLRSGHWSGITPSCVDESESLQNVAERFKEKFITNVGSHSSDITWDTKSGKKEPCPSTEEEAKFPCDSPSTEKDINASEDLLETEYDHDLSPISIDFPPNDPNFIRKHKRRHKNKRRKLAFEPSLLSIAEEFEEEEVFSGDVGSGEEKVLLMDNTPCYKIPSLKRVKNDTELRNSFKNGEMLPTSRPTNRERGRKRYRKLRNNYKSLNKSLQPVKYKSNIRDRRIRRKYSKNRRITVEDKIQEKLILSSMAQ